MNRRDLFKLVGLFTVAPFLPKVAGCPSVPRRYRGFDITIGPTTNPNHIVMGADKYFHAGNGKYHQGAIFSDKPDIEIWRQVKPALDGAIDRHNKTLS